MRPTTRHLAACIAFYCLTSAPAAEPKRDVKALREAVLKAESSGGKAPRYQALFEKVG